VSKHLSISKPFSSIVSW